VVFCPAFTGFLRTPVTLKRMRDSFRFVASGTAYRYGSLFFSIRYAMVTIFRAAAVIATLRFFFFARRRY